MDIGGDRLRLRDEVRREPSLLPLLAARIVSPQGTAHASEQFVRRDRFYEIANHRDRAGDPTQSPGLQQACGPRKHGRREAGRLEQILRCFPDRLIIIDDRNQRPLGQFDLPMAIEKQH